MPSGSPIGTTRTFGARSIVGIRMVSGLISPWPIILGGIIISALGSQAQAFQNLQVLASSGGLTLWQTSTSAEVSEPPAHLEVEIKPCRAADSQLGKCPRRVQHHWSGRALARLLPVGGSYSFAFSPPVAVPNAWLLCLRRDDLGWTPSGSQVGVG